MNQNFTFPVLEVSQNMFLENGKPNVTKDNYNVWAARTMPDLGSVAANLAHMAMGITTEQLEALEALAANDMPNAIEEIGDDMWYVANAANLLNLNWQTIIDKAYGLIDQDLSLTNEFVGDLPNIVDAVKRVFAYGKEIDVEKFETMIVHRVVFHIDAIDELRQHGLIDKSFREILQINIEKLFARFPDKFNKQDALERDLAAEREILEQ